MSRRARKATPQARKTIHLRGDFKRKKRKPKQPGERPPTREERISKEMTEANYQRCQVCGCQKLKKAIVDGICKRCHDKQRSQSDEQSDHANETDQLRTVAGRDSFRVQSDSRDVDRYRTTAALERADG